jgi:catechol 2,3-dioxygenase-like lactoylglutathione lyase family enzyme
MTDVPAADPGVRSTVSPVTGLSHLQLNVSDVAVSAEWYTAVLGLEPYARDPDVGYVALRHRTGRMVIVLTSAPASGAPIGPRSAVPGPGIAGTLDHVAFAVPDGDALRAWAGHLTTIGIEHAGVVLEGGNPSLQLRDPDGLAVELVAPGAPRGGAPG